MTQLDDKKHNPRVNEKGHICEKILYLLTYLVFELQGTSHVYLCCIGVFFSEKPSFLVFSKKTFFLRFLTSYGKEQ